MISVTQLRNGTNFVDRGRPFRVLKYEHAHISRGAGNIKVKVRNLENGSVTNLTYKSGAKVEDISVEKRRMQYLYKSEDDLVLMNPVSFEQVELEGKIVGDDAKYLIEGSEVNVLFWDSKILGLDLPPNLVYKVKDTVGSEKGNSATNVLKPAVMENGLKANVPLFIKIGDRVKVDTRSGEYVERVS